MDDPYLFLYKTVKAIRVLKCSSSRAMKLVPYRLEGLAKQWYETLLAGRLPALPPLTWEEFFEAFMTRFLPATRGRI